MKNLTFTQFINDLYNNIDRKIVYSISYETLGVDINVANVKYLSFSYIKYIYETLKEFKSNYIFID